ncbi:MAG TPA: VOC family protein [Motiliproteus sp.]
MPMPAQLSYLTLAVTTLEPSLRFYRDGLGLLLLKQSERLAFFDLGGVRLALWQRDDFSADTGLALSSANSPHSCQALNVCAPEAVDQLLASAACHGGTLVQAAGAPSWGGRRGYCRDPDGFLWEVAWHPDYALR